MNSESKSQVEPTTLNYAPASRKRKEFWVTSFLVISAGLFGISLLLPKILPQFQRARITDYKDWCNSNLRGIGQAMFIYAYSDPNGEFPDELGKLIEANTVAPKQFNCPSAVAPGKSFSYITGATLKSPPKTIVMFEHADNHRGRGCNILYADGRVEFVSMSQMQAIINTAASSGKVVHVNDMSEHAVDCEK